MIPRREPCQTAIFSLSALLSSALLLIPSPAFADDSMPGMTHDHEMPMAGTLGPYPMSREAAGTSWQPESTPNEHFSAMHDDWMLMAHGYANFIYDDQGSPRGGKKAFSASMLMLMADRPLGPGTFGLQSMLSLDPAMGSSGYPLLFQAGETGNGKTILIDRQHPHDLFMELAMTYSVPVGDDSSVFGYLGLPGEPALGPTVYMHRYSGMDIPETPLTHHWLDSTHASFGVATIGSVWKNIKLEGSAFRGREPDRYRWDEESPKFDSFAARISYCPTEDWALQTSYGHLHSPEQLAPDTNTGRVTTSASRNNQWGKNFMQTTFGWGRDMINPGHKLDGFLLESALHIQTAHILFGRLERVDRDDLFTSGEPLAGQIFTIGKLSIGYIYNLPTQNHLQYGFGGLISTYATPKSLDSAYGKNPSSFMIWIRMKML